MVVFAKSEFLYIAPIWSEGAKRPENGTFQEKIHGFLIFGPRTKFKKPKGAQRRDKSNALIPIALSPSDHEISTK